MYLKHITLKCMPILFSCLAAAIGSKGHNLVFPALKMVIKGKNSCQYTIMDFSAGVHDVICTRKINIDRGGSRGQYYFFLVHITSCTPAEKAINVLLYNQPVL